MRTSSSEGNTFGSLLMHGPLLCIQCATGHEHRRESGSVPLRYKDEPEMVMAVFIRRGTRYGDGHPTANRRLCSLSGSLVLW